MSNDELLFKYAELYEKGLLTKEEFDKKKKELLFSDNSFEKSTVRKITENYDDNENVITVASNNFSKLLSCDIGDIILIHQSKYKFTAIDFQIIDIQNPDNIDLKKTDDVVVRVVEKNFNIVRDSDVLTVKHKRRSGQITLKRC